MVTDMNMNITRYILLMIAITAGGAWATVIDGGFNQSITPADSWTAGSDAALTWYGSNYSAAEGQAQLTRTSTVNFSHFNDNVVDHLLLAMPLNGITADTYSMGIETTYSSFDNQFFFWQIYLAHNGASIDLQNAFGDVWDGAFDDAHLIQTTEIAAPSGQLYSRNFTLSSSDLEDYDYIAFVFTGSRDSCQSLAFDNFTTTMAPPVIPEPLTVLTLAGGAAWLLRKKRRTCPVGHRR